MKWTLIFLLSLVGGASGNLLAVEGGQLTNNQLMIVPAHPFYSGYLGAGTLNVTILSPSGTYYVRNLVVNATVNSTSVTCYYRHNSNSWNSLACAVNGSGSVCAKDPVTFPEGESTFTVYCTASGSTGQASTTVTVRTHAQGGGGIIWLPIILVLSVLMYVVMEDEAKPLRKTISQDNVQGTRTKT